MAKEGHGVLRKHQRRGMARLAVGVAHVYDALRAGLTAM